MLHWNGSGDLTALPSRSVDRRAEDFMVMNQKNAGSGLIENNRMPGSTSNGK
jgi:hypothetical protein